MHTKTAKYLELILLYILAPLFAYVLIHEYRIPLFVILAPMFIGFALLLFLDRNFDQKEFWSRGFNWRDSARIITLFVISSFILTTTAYYYESERFLAFVKYRPQLWLLVMFLYPLISVTTQELMYRVLFFHRYAPLFGQNPWPVIILGAVFFAYCHILFQNWQAIIISFGGGLLFGYTYYHTRSFWAVCIEHSLYGCLLFTIGFGHYFFTGVSSVRFIMS